MQKAAYKTKQQDLLFSYLREMQGKHFTAEDVRAHFEEKKLSIGLTTILLPVLNMPEKNAAKTTITFI